MRKDTSCPTCRHEVPAGRWCNRCGGPLADLVAPPRARRRWLVPAAGGTAVAAALAAVVVLGRPDAAPTAAPSALDDTAVVLAEDPPAPPSPTPTRPTSPPLPPSQRVDVICSDLRVRSVPVDAVSSTVPGELVELSAGTCVVMDQPGVVVP